eukprot:CAMPEP_0181183702 /NCGR_PEP_ID=MMETSP1096-20121128/8566_1 /TAXON_ID=156174 ORGANISM="Chrysochromulina ericina, Strain CCMP281" /NCGR_SAMPLE_ID=MMETSP1096 /ASSEMBLY_ACC=CAM_ASM_000453 /LENGTH=136 /DNA_ID=CAMNT_0023272399 /DNA_START=196 /DNA_END=608 /DNA_ORIENTATION=-
MTRDQPSSKSGLIQRHVAEIPKRQQRHAATWADDDVRDRAVEAAQTQPRLRRQLQRPQREIADDVHVANQDLVHVLASIAPPAALAALLLATGRPLTEPSGCKADGSGSPPAGAALAAASPGAEMDNEVAGGAAGR